MISTSLRDFVRQRANYYCEYCQTAEWLNGLEGEIDHIKPRAIGGPTVSENLCLACSSCNGNKHSKTHGIDPDTGAKVELFHPRRQVWHEHFMWSEDGTRILGLTSCGRATIATLQMNHTLVVAARLIWVRAGYHPPGRTVYR